MPETLSFASSDARTDGDSSANESGFAGQMLSSQFKTSIDYDTGALTSDMLYFILAGDKFLKIGRTNNIEKRLLWIQGACPLKVVLVGTIENAGWTERAWHRIFRFERERGEWFKVTGELHEVVMAALNGDDWVMSLGPDREKSAEARQESARKKLKILRSKFELPECVRRNLTETLPAHPSFPPILSRGSGKQPC